MKLTDAAWLSGTSLMKNPLRTVLTILGLAVGVAAVLSVVTLGAAGQIQVENEIDKLGVDKVWITVEQGSGGRLTPDSAEAVEAAARADACATAYTAGAALYHGQAAAVTVAGYDGGVSKVLHPQLSAGRMFMPREFDEGRPVALVDQALLELWGEEVLGQRIELGNRMVTVVGALQPIAGQAAAGTVYLPLKTLLDTYAGSGVSEITMAVPRGVKADDVAAMALSALGDGYRAATLQNEIDAARSVIRIFVMVLACVAAVCVLTGGIGVMNILLVSVRERRREIGLMKAVGGTARQVAALFLLEAMGYAVMGGILGMMIGMGMIRGFGWLIGLDTALSPATAVVTLLGAALLGAGFGVLPAIRASAMQPVDALKQQ